MANWIKNAIKRPGALHKDLGVPAGKPISASKLAAAKKSKSGETRRRAFLAATLKSFHKG